MQDVKHEDFMPRDQETEKKYFRFQLGIAQWGEDDRSIGYAWWNKNREHARGTEFEIPEDIFPHLVAFATKHGYLSWDAVIQAAVELEQKDES